MIKKQGNGLAIFLMGCALMPAAHAKESATPKQDNKKVSYGIGVDIGRNFKRLDLEVDLDQLAKGLKDAYTGKKLGIDANELRTIMSAYQNELKEKQQTALVKALETNQKASDAFFAENGKKSGVITLPSGLQYTVIQQGDGKKPTDNDTVECKYRGTLLDGTEFDSSDRVGKPVQFKVSNVIPGWKEALKLMPVGSKWRLFIPPQLGYAERGAGREIGPNATHIFDVELIGIKAGQPEVAVQ